LSFSSKTKNELSKLVVKNDCCLVSELTALIQTSGIVQIAGQQRINLKVITENASIARRLFMLLKAVFNINTEVMVRKNIRLKKNNSYVLLVTSQMGAGKLLERIGILKRNSSGAYDLNYGINPRIVRKNCCKRAYIRGAFLGCGSISDPEKTYHVEFVTTHEEYAHNLSELINHFQLNSKITMRKSNFVIYLKEGEQIVDLLNIIGAHSALLKLENIRIYKEMRNNVNRIVNCETANLSKTVNAAIRQIRNIEYIRDTIGLEKLPNNLKEIARLRLSHSEASLKELGEMLSPPIGKSGVNHRLRKLDAIAEALIKKGDGYNETKHC